MLLRTALQSAHKVSEFCRGKWADALLFLIFTGAIFQFPEQPVLGLDPSWKMVLARTFHDGLQFGRDVVYNYGPLGFLMGNTYFGLHFGCLIAWQLFAAAVFAAIIVWNGRELGGVSRTAYMIFFLLFGIIYPDALYMIAIALLGLELIRRDRWVWRYCGPIAVLFATFAFMKFTNLLFTAVVTVVIGLHRVWIGRVRDAGVFVGLYGAAGLAVWSLCRQNLLNLPAYLMNSLQITAGYQEAMGTPVSPVLLWKALVVLMILGTYLVFHVGSHPNKPRAIACTALLSCFIFLDWKHGFVRPDAHVLVFFISALVPVAAFPGLMSDPIRFRWLQRALLLGVGALSVLGIHDLTREEDVPPYVRQGFGMLEEDMWTKVSDLSHWGAFCESYEKTLRDQQSKFDLPRTRETVGSGTLDVIGNEQAIVFYNHLNYTPRPVFQSFCAYNPLLAQLNFNFFTSSRAPDFALVKIQTIDGRLPAFDDSLLLRLLVERYEFVLEEKDFTLWKRRRLPFSGNPVSSRCIRSEDLELNTPLQLGSLSGRNLWMRVDLQASFAGALRKLFYKPAAVNLNIVDIDGVSSTYSMPLSEARTGFILNPVIEDNEGYLHFSNGQPGRRVRTLSVEVAREDARYFMPAGKVELFDLTPVAP